MKKTKHFFLIFLCVVFTSPSCSQNLTLNITSPLDNEKPVIDSLRYIKTHAGYASIISEIASFQKKLYQMGYIENEQQTKKLNDTVVEAEFHLKKKYNAIHIYYDRNSVATSILNSISKKVFASYFVLPFKDVESALNFINLQQTKKGYPFSKLRLSHISADETGTLNARLVLDHKNKRAIDAILVKGYEKFPKSYIRHYLKIRRDQPLDLDLIKGKTEQLNGLRFANQIKPPEVLFTKDSTTLYIYIEKSKSNTFDGFLGFGTNEQTNKIEFNGYLNLNLVNNLNYGETFSLLYKSTQNEQKSFEAHITLPYLLKTPIGVDVQLHIYKQDSTFTTIDQAARLQYQINANHTVYTGFKATESNKLSNYTRDVAISDYKSNFATIAYQFSKPQYHSLLFPLNTNIYIETGFGSRTIATASEKQNMWNFDAFKIFNLNKKNSLYISGNGAGLITGTYFENELSRFGGINSLRGFEENSLLATSYGAINTEYRHQLGNTIYIHSIFDLAYLQNRLTSSKEKLFGYGFGFGIWTKTGLFKLNYANGKSENQPFKFSNSKIHLSLIANF